MGYRKDIDGLRALAVLPVILAHAGFSWIPGGFLGVDVFFVISGYLITALLLRELSETGKVKLGNFYLRRARRILPALFLVIVVTAVFSWFILLPEELSRFGESIVWTTLFSSNIFFALETDYFAPDASLSPLLHTWSLAVEEQFYLFFPLILILLWKRGRRWVIPSTLLVIFIGSLILAQYGNQILGSSWSYYSLATRAWELVAGSLAAVWISLRGKPRPRLILSGSGLFGLLISYFVFNDSVIHPGFLTVIPVISVLLLIAFTGAESVIYKILASPPLVFIGLISYSAYLWHQPLFALYRTYNFLPPSIFELWALVLTTLILASISWRWVERPFRKPQAKTSGVKRSILGFVASTASLLMIGSGMSNPGFTSERVSFNGVKFSDVSAKIQRYHGLSPECQEFTGTNPECTSADSPSVLLWGDSYAMHLAGSLLAVEPDTSFSQSTLSECAPIVDVAYSKDGSFSDKQTECLFHNEKTFNYIVESKDIQIVVMSSPWLSLIRPGRHLGPNGEVQSSQDISNKLSKQLRIISDSGKRVVLVGPPPMPGYVPSSCLARRELSGLELLNCNFPLTENTNKDREQALLLFENESTSVLLLSEIMCQSDECITTNAGEFFYGHGGHLSPNGSNWLGSIPAYSRQILSE